MSVLLLTMGPQLGITADLPVVGVGGAGVIRFRPIGASGPVKWTLVDSTLPAEWDSALNPDGNAVTLTTSDAETAGTFRVTVRAVDSARIPVVRSFDVRVMALPLTISGAFPNWQVGQPATGALTISGGVPPYSGLAVISGALPAGVSLSIVGNQIVASGSPTVAGPWSAVLQVSDVESASAQLALSGTVADVDPDPYWSYLVSGYHFDGVITDVKGRSPTTLIGDVVWPPGRFGQAISPETPGNGDAAGVIAPNIVLGTEDFAIDFWINVPSITLGGAIISNFQLVTGAAGWQVYLTAGGKLQWYYYFNAGLYPLTSIYDLRGAGFTHIRINRIAGTMRLFVNGVLDSSVADTQNYNQGGLTSICYQAYGLARYPLDAAIDDLRIYKGTGISAEGFSPPVIPFPDQGP